VTLSCAPHRTLRCLSLVNNSFFDFSLDSKLSDPSRDKFCITSLALCKRAEGGGEEAKKKAPRSQEEDDGTVVVHNKNGNLSIGFPRVRVLVNG
jgi:hypothetical protein